MAWANSYSNIRKAIFFSDELESNIAIYPRIVIDTCLKPSPILVGWAQDEDGIWYADYLTLGYTLLCNPHNGETPIPHDEFLSYIVSHKNGICSALEKYKTNDRVYIKYRWLASYHNRFCRHTELSDLIIDIGRQWYSVSICRKYRCSQILPKEQIPSRWELTHSHRLGYCQV